MIVNQENINQIFNKYILFVNEISEEYNYSNNIKHLLYVIVPAFIIKYGIDNESSVLKCFRNVKVYISNHSKNVNASFNRNLKKNENGYYTEKYITVNPFNDSSLSNILDNFIHEFNHAVNSINNEIIVTNNLIKVRTGLTTLNYNKEDLSYIEKSEETVLEELLNTSQTEEIINIIKSFSKYNIDNPELSNTLFNINKEIGEELYKSDAYSYQKTVCETLLNNKTFTPTINNLRFKGLIEDIPELFDNVMGEKNKYRKLNELLSDMYVTINKYSSSRFFKNKYLNKIISLSNDVTSIIKEYETKCIFK